MLGTPSKCTFFASAAAASAAASLAAALLLLLLFLLLCCRSPAVVVVFVVALLCCDPTWWDFVGSQVTGEPLTRRSDDTVDKLRSRLKAFHKQTQPVIDHYERAGKTVTIDAKQDKNVRPVTSTIIC